MGARRTGDWFWVDGDRGWGAVFESKKNSDEMVVTHILMRERHPPGPRPTPGHAIASFVARMRASSRESRPITSSSPPVAAGRQSPPPHEAEPPPGRCIPLPLSTRLRYHP